MEIRPKIKLELTRSDRFIESIGWGLLSLLWILTLLSYENLPETIPTHFNGLGQVNDYGSKMTLMFLPVMGTLLFIGLTALNNYPHIFNLPVKVTKENAFRQYTNATRMIRVLKIIIVVIFSLVVFVIVKAVKSDKPVSNIWLLPVILGLVLVPNSYFFIKSIKMK
jgi:uncharacterized membrane protein